MGCDGALIGFAGTATARARSTCTRRSSAQRLRARVRDLGAPRPARALLLARADPRLPAADEGSAEAAGPDRARDGARAAARRRRRRARGAAAPRAHAGLLAAGAARRGGLSAEPARTRGPSSVRVETDARIARVVPGAAGRALGGPDGRRSRSAARDGAFAVGHTRPTVERAARRATDGSDIGPAQGAARSAWSPSRSKRGHFTAELARPAARDADERNASVDSAGRLRRRRNRRSHCAGRAWRCGPRPGRARWSPKQVGCARRRVRRRAHTPDRRTRRAQSDGRLRHRARPGRGPQRRSPSRSKSGHFTSAARADAQRASSTNAMRASVLRTSERIATSALTELIAHRVTRAAGRALRAARCRSRRRPPHADAAAPATIGRAQCPARSAPGTRTQCERRFRRTSGTHRENAVTDLTAHRVTRAVGRALRAHDVGAVAALHTPTPLHRRPSGARSARPAAREAHGTQCERRFRRTSGTHREERLDRARSTPRDARCGPGAACARCRSRRRPAHADAAAPATIGRAQCPARSAPGTPHAMRASVSTRNRNAAIDAAPQHAVDEVQRAIGARRELRVVRDDDERRADGAIELEHQVEHLARGLAVEVAGRLVGEHAARPRHQRARERDALALAAGQLARQVLAGGAPRPTRSSIARACARAASAGVAADRERHRDVLERGELRQQVVELVDEAERAVAHAAALGFATATRTAGPRRATSPAVGASSPPSRCSSVLLPEPGRADDRDALADARPSRSTPISTGTSSGPLR